MSKNSKVGDQEVQIDRRRKTDRREVKAVVAEDAGSFQPPRRKQQRRRQIDPTTCEREYTDPEIQFMQALDAYKRSSGRMFPTCSEILEVIKDLGYVQLSAEERSVLESIKQVELELIQATTV
jgi:hypothetical protein